MSKIYRRYIIGFSDLNDQNDRWHQYVFDKYEPNRYSLIPASWFSDRDTEPESREISREIQRLIQEHYDEIGESIEYRQVSIDWG